MDNPLSIQIHNRERYAQGELSGAWLALPASVEQLHAAMRQVGITAESGQDLFINGLNTDIEAVSRLSLDKLNAAGIDELNYLAARLEALSPGDIVILNAAGDAMGYWDDARQLNEYAHNTDFFVHIPDVTDATLLGDYYLNKSGMIQMPDAWKGAVDLAKLGRIAAEQEHGSFTDRGYILESGDVWQQVTEVPEQYRIMSYPPQEQQHDTPQMFGRDFAQTMTEFYTQHPASMETTQMANTSPDFIAHQIEIGLTVSYLDGALNALEAEAAYRETAATFRQRLEALPQPGRDDPSRENDAVATRAPVVATVAPPEPQPVIPIVLQSEKPAEKLKEITDKLETGIADIFNSEQYRDYLNTLSKFHNYSLNNTILIAMQKPDATYVAGFNTWKNEFERNVMKGQKGIKIIAPSPYKVKTQREKTDPATGKPVMGADGKPVTEEVERKIPAYKVASVFDVSQTEGKELPTIGADTLIGDVERYGDFFAALEKASPVTVAFEAIEGGANGYYHQVEKRIAIDEGMSELQTLKTTIHEIAHARLHDIDKSKEQDEPPRADRRTREVEAESIAYTVCQHYGLDTSDYSFGYVAGWSNGKELTELKASLETIRTAAAQLITEIDGHFAELQQDREQTSTHEQQPGFEQWSEPATPENAPENSGEPSDDIDAYPPRQDNSPTPQPEQAEPTTTATYYPINEEAARRAKEANSYSDYRPGSVTAEYQQMVDEATQVAERQKARVDPMHHEKIDRLLHTYARKLAENMNNSSAIDSRVPSILITGGGNFPTRKKEKQNAARDRNMEEWRDIQGLLDKIRSTGMGGISADDPNAVQKLQEKLSGLEQLQDTMKTANAYYRKHKALDGCPVLSAEQIQKLTGDMKNRWYGREATQPFEPYALQNNNAEIRRLKGRIEQLGKMETAVFTGWQFEGGKVEINKPDNRLQVFFDGKPDADTRTELKSNGFRWTPSVGAWQRQLNANAFYAANEVGSIQPLTGEKPTELQRRARREANAAQQPAPEQERRQGDTYAIYQLKDDDSIRDIRFEPYERLQAAGLAVDPAKYVFVYSEQLGKEETLDTIFERFNISHPADFTGHSLSASDVVTLNRDGVETAHYVDSFGYKNVPEFLHPAPAFDVQQTADRLQKISDAVMNADPNKTMGVAAYNVALKRLDRLNGEIPDSQQQLKAAIGHAAGSTDLETLKQRMGGVMHEISHIRTAEMSTEQNYNMIDGIPNNTPSVDELEAQAKAGERISLYDLAAAIKADKADEHRDTDKKPSIRAQLKADKEQLDRERAAAPKTAAQDKNAELEV